MSSTHTNKLLRDRTKSIPNYKVHIEGNVKFSEVAMQTSFNYFLSYNEQSKYRLIFLPIVLHINKLSNYRLFKHFWLIARGIINTTYSIDSTSFANVIGAIHTNDYLYSRMCNSREMFWSPLHSAFASTRGLAIWNRLYFVDNSI